MASLQPSWLPPIRLRYLFLVTLVFGSCVMMIVFNGHEFVSLDGEQLRTADYYHLGSETHFTIKTDGCTIPALRPVDDNIKKFIEPPRHVKPCRHMNTSLLASNATHIWINNNHRHFYNLSQDFNISCCYKAFYRPNAIPDITSAHVDDRVSYHKCIQFHDVIEALDEFVRVSCYDSNMGKRESLIYEDFFIFAFKKPLSSVRNAQNSHNQSTKAYNVIVLGIDAVSRLNFHRTMPRTLEFLKKKGAVELLGYNKIGDNTFPNVAAMLLGVKDTEMKHMCWPSRKHTFDNCPFVWDSYKENGFYTAFGEDSAHLGTFNYARQGFAATPTDYYLHTFTREAEVHVGNNKDNSFLCMGNRFAFKILLNYVERLTNILQSSKLFGFFWEVTMSHDYLNNPKALDDNYEYFFKNLDKSKYLEETVIILLSDHGLRWGKFRTTKQGRLEERLPFVHILLPPSFQHTYSLAYHHLKLNSNHLTTPYDVYATLLDLVNLDSISDEEISARKKQHYAESRNISLFMPIPRNRTCKIAGIDDHWCTCHKDHALSVESDEAKDAAKFVVSHLNEQLKQHQECARLSLDSIVGVREMEAGTPEVNEVGWRELLVVVRAKPGGGLFEATLRRTVRGAVATGGAFTSDTADWALSGSVSRLNLYGTQSHCVQDYLLKLYCVCDTAVLRQKVQVL